MIKKPINMVQNEAAPTVTSKMMKCFRDHQEPVLVSINVNRISRFNISQAKVFVLTGENIYLFDGNRCRCREEISSISAIIKSSVTTEFVIVIPCSKDIRI